jgi:Tol biopolymer transport system component
MKRLILFASVLVVMFLSACNSKPAPQSVIIYQTSKYLRDAGNGTKISTSILVKNLGMGGENLTGNWEDVTLLAASHDGKQVLFSRNQEKELWVVNTNMTGLTKILDISPFYGVYSNPPYERTYNPVADWSPDGKKIAIAGKDTLCFYNSDGSGKTCIDDIRTRDFWPLGSLKWSPDGKTIAVFASDPNPETGFESEIRFFNADSSFPDLYKERLTLGSSASPSWSPDGKKIAFSTWSGMEETFQGMGITGVGVYNPITIFPITAVSDASWSPDGKKIAVAGFDRFHVVGAQIYIFDLASNTYFKPVSTDDTVDSYSPVWSPDGKTIVFARSLPGDNVGLKDQLCIMDAKTYKVTVLQEIDDGLTWIGDIKWGTYN